MKRYNCLLIWLLATALISGCGTPSGPQEEHSGDSPESHTATAEHEEDGNHEEHIHEQYGIREIQPEAFADILHTSGKLLPARSDELTLTAIHDGLVVFRDLSLFPGRKVEQGKVLMTISGRELIHDNIQSGYLDAQVAYENARKEYERAQALNADRIISDRDFQNARLEFEQARNRYETIRKHYSEGGQNVVAGLNGYVKEVLVSEGEFVKTGQPLLSLARNRRMVVRADVPQQYLGKLAQIRSATFSTVYERRIYDTRELNGKLISYGLSPEDQSLFTPLFIEIDNPGTLFTGSYLEIFLRMEEHEDCIVIPGSSVLEEAGRYYVYLESEEGFEKRFIQLGNFDGKNYRVESGLQAGEHLVTRNPYQIKLASLSNSLPAHSHQH